MFDLPPLITGYIVIAVVGLVALLAACRWSCEEYDGNDF